jgi:hypothetical protein
LNIKELYQGFLLLEIQSRPNYCSDSVFLLIEINFF